MKFLSLFGIYFLCAGAMFFPMIFSQFGNSQTLENPEKYYQILYIYRNWHHFLPQLFPTSHYVKFSLLSVIMMAICMKKDFPNRKFILFSILLFWLGFTIYALGMYDLKVPALGKTQWAKASILIQFLGIAVFSGFASSKLKPIMIDIQNRLFHPIFVLSGSVIMVLILNLSGFISMERIRGKYQTGFYQKTELTSFHEKVKNFTAINALFLVPPSDDSFACESERSSIIGYRAVIHEPWFLMKWFDLYSKMCDVPLEDGLKENVLNLSENRFCESVKTKSLNLEPQAVNYIVCHESCIAEKNVLKFAVLQEGPWVLLKW